MAQAFDLLSLPASAFCDVLSFVASLKVFVRLDSAHCLRCRRDLWLKLLRSKQFTLQCITDLSESHKLAWVSKKCVRCVSVKFSRDMVACRTVVDYLRESGESVRTVHFDGGTKAFEMIMVAYHCKHLTTLRISNVNVSCAMREVMLQNSNLQEIDCVNVKCAEADIFAGESLHKLEKLRAYEATCQKGFPWHETAFSNSLKTVLWEASDFFTSDMLTLFQNCPGIRSFSAGLVNMEHQYIARMCTNIVSLSLNNNIILTDTSILSVKCLTSLRMLDIQNCSELTDASLQHLAESMGDRLEVLYIDIKRPESVETEDSLRIFSQKCSKLRYFNVNCGENALCGGEGTSLLALGCPALRTLVVNKRSTIGASSRGFTAHLRPELKILERSAVTSFSIWLEMVLHPPTTLILFD